MSFTIWRFSITCPFGEGKRNTNKLSAFASRSAAAQLNNCFSNSWCNTVLEGSYSTWCKVINKQKEQIQFLSLHPQRWRNSQESTERERKWMCLQCKQLEEVNDGLARRCGKLFLCSLWMHKLKQSQHYWAWVNPHPTRFGSSLSH